MSWFKEAKAGDKVGSDELTAAGAAELNAYGLGVARGIRPTVGEIVTNGLFVHGRKRGNLISGEVKAAKAMVDGDKEIFPSRKSWSLSKVDDWLAARIPVRRA